MGSHRSRLVHAVEVATFLVLLLVYVALLTLGTLGSLVVRRLRALSPRGNQSSERPQPNV